MHMKDVVGKFKRCDGTKGKEVLIISQLERSESEGFDLTGK